MDILTLFFDVYDFCSASEPAWWRRLMTDRERRRNKPGALSLSEVMAILIPFHASGYRYFKYFYTGT